MSEIDDEIDEDKESHKELPVLRRMTKRQVQEVYSLLEEGKTLEEISQFFEKRYKCKPLSKWRLQKHLTNFHKLKDEEEKFLREKDERNDETIKVIENKIHSVQPYNNNTYENTYGNTYGNQEIERKEDDLSGINLKFLIFIFFFILMLYKIFYIIQKRKEKKLEPKSETIEETHKKQGLNVKWV